MVLSHGMHENLGVPDTTVKWLGSKGVEVYVAETREGGGDVECVETGGKEGRRCYSLWGCKRM